MARNDSIGGDGDEPTGGGTIRRRTILRGVSAGLAATTLAGCNTTEERRYEADPAALQAEAGGLGFSLESAGRPEVSRTQTVGGVTLEITLVNYAATYGGSPVDLSVGATPAAEEGGQQLNPVASASLRELLTGEVGAPLRRQVDLGIDADTEWSRGPEELSSRSGQLLGSSVDVKTFVGVTSEAEAVLLHAVKTDHEGDVVFVTSGRSREYPSGDDRPLAGEGGVFEEAEVDAGVESFQESLPMVVRDPAQSLSGQGGESGASLELSLENEGPFTVGEDTARVLVTATDADGNPLTDLSLTALKFTGRDTVETLDVETVGGGEYLVQVTDTHAGETGLQVKAADATAAGDIAVPFEPAEPASLNLEDVEQVPEGDPGGDAGQPRDPVVRPGEDLAGSFSITVRDEFGNLLDPFGIGTLVLEADRENVVLEREVDQENKVVDVRATFEGTPEPNLERPSEGWGTIGVTVSETEVLGQRETVEFEFPFVHFEQTSREVDGEPRTVIRFYSLNFRPLRDYRLFLPVEAEKIEAVVNPDPNNGFSEPVVEPGTGEMNEDEEGVYIASEEPRPVEEIDDPTTEFAEVILSPELLDNDLVELPLEWRIDVPELQIPPYVYDIPAKLLTAVNLCLKIWKGPGTDQNRVNQAIKEMRDVFDRSVENCCPVVFFDVEEETISSSEWNSIDANGDGELSQWWSKKQVQDGNGNTIEVPDLTTEEQNLFNNYHEDGCLNAYYVPDVAGGTWGRAYGEVTGGNTWTYDTNDQMDGDSVVLNNDDRAGDNKSLAHELGHIVGELVDHGPGTFPHGVDNIQSDPPKPGTGGHWTPEQCSEIDDVLR